MPASKQLKVLSVRLPEPDVRKLKSLAASRDVSLQEAVRQALRAWTLLVPQTPREPLDTLQGSLAAVDIRGLMKREKQAERVKDRRWS